MEFAPSELFQRLFEITEAKHRDNMKNSHHVEKMKCNNKLIIKYSYLY